MEGLIEMPLFNKILALLYVLGVNINIAVEICRKKFDVLLGEDLYK